MAGYGGKCLPEADLGPLAPKQTDLEIPLGSVGVGEKFRKR